MHVITYDPAKRAKTIKERQLDFVRANEVWDKSDLHFTYEDERFSYGENRYITVGYLDERMVVIVWTPRGEARHVISMRKANAKEQKRYKKRMD